MRLGLRFQERRSVVPLSQRSLFAATLKVVMQFALQRDCNKIPP